MTDGRARPRETLVEQASRHLPAAAAYRSLCGALHDHGLVEAPAPSTPSEGGGSAQARAQAVATQQRIAETEVRLRDSTGGQIGDHNQQFNTLVVQVPGRHLDFADVLKRPGVSRAIKDLQQDRSSAELRQKLVNQLQSDGVRFRPAQITVKPRESGFGAFMRRAFFFDVVEDIQVSDHNTQHNHRTYIASTVPSDIDLLHDNPQLASDLADCVCPRPGQERDAQSLRDRTERALQSSEVSFKDGRARGVQYEGETLGKVLRIERTDFFTVGLDNRQVNELHVDVVELATPAPPPDSGRKLSAYDWLNPFRTTPDRDDFSRGRPDRGQREIDGRGGGFSR